MLTGLALGVLVAGCSSSPDTGPVQVSVAGTAPASSADAATCAAFIAALPATLAGEDSRPVEPSGAPARAYGDPAITVTCGVSVPADYAPGAGCQVADGVGWYLPQSEFDDQGSDATLTAVGHRPVVQLVLPHQYRPNGAAAALASLASPVKQHLKLLERCR